MAYTEDTRPEDLDALTAPAGTDILVIVDDPTVTPLTKKITIANLLAGIEDATSAVTSGYAGTDTLLFIDGGVAAYTTIANFLAGIEDALSDIAAVPALTDTLLLIDGGTAKTVTKRNLQVRYVEVRLVAYDTDCATGDKQGGWHFHIPPDLNGLDLVYVHAEVDTAGTTNTMDLEIYNVTQTADMLSTTLTIDTTESGSDTAATPYEIDTNNDDVATNDLIRVDCDAVHTTAAKGLVVTLGFG